MMIVNSLNFSGKLSSEHRKSFDENGFIVVKNVVSQEELTAYCKRFKEICQSVSRDAYPPGMTVMKDVALRNNMSVPPEDCINKLQDFQEDPVLFRYCSNSKVLDVVEQLLGPNILAMHTMLINKPPDPGTKTSRHPMHQDLHYFPFRPAEKIICAWTAMERVTRANGCLVVVPGSHKGLLLPHDYPKWEGGVNKMYHGIQDLDPAVLERRIHVEMDPGDVVFFHPLLIHGSGANTTTGYRKAISCHYAAGDCDYISIGGTSQENIAQEVMDLVRSRYGKDVEVAYEDVWRFRARLVRGIRSRL